MPKKNVPHTRRQEHAQKLLREAEADKRTAQAMVRRLGGPPGQKAANPVRKDGRVRRSGDCLSSCTKNYLSIATNPFQEHPASFCLPLPPCLPSQNMTAFCRGIFNSNTTTGFGFVGFNPYVAVGNGQLANFAPVKYTNTGFTGSSLSSAPATGLATANTNSVVAYTSIGEISGNSADQVNYRVVGAGVRVRYMGTELDRGGRFIGACHPDNFSYKSGVTAAELLADSGVATTAVDRKWHSVLWTPRNPSDYEFNDGSTDEPFLPSGDVEPGVLVIAYQAGGLVAVSIEFECFVQFEIIGPGAHGQMRRLPDPIGGVAAVEYLQDFGGRALNSVKWAADAYRSVSRIVESFSGMPYAGSAAAQILESEL